MNAKEKGCKIVISTDAHSTAALDWMKYGVRTAAVPGSPKRMC